MRPFVRPWIAVLLLAVVVSSSGCLGNEPLAEYAAQPATIGDAALEPTGWTHGNTTDITYRRPVGVGPLSRDVVITGWLSGYSKNTTDGDTAVLLVSSTPDAEVAGQSVNPLGRLSNPELVDAVLARAGKHNVGAGVRNASGLRRVGTETRTVLGQPAEIATYSGTVDRDGRRVAALIHVVTVAHGDDIVAAIAIHPEGFDERDNVFRLVERIDHPAADTAR